MKSVNRWRWHLLGAAVGLAVVFSHAGAALAEEKDSGFLRDYSRLEETKTGGGGPIRQWVSPKLTPDNYNALLLDPVVFYPEPRPSEKVSAEALQQIITYLNDNLRRTLGERFRFADSPGPGVLRLRIALTSVATKEEGIKPYQLIPIALVVTVASRAAKGTPERALLILEFEGTDSVTGQLLGMRVRVGTGEKLAEVGDKKVITLQTLKPILDDFVKSAFPDLEKFVKRK